MGNYSFSFLKLFRQGHMLINTLRVPYRPLRSGVCSSNNYINVDLSRAQFYSTTDKACNKKPADDGHKDQGDKTKSKIISQLYFQDRQHAKPFYNLPVKTLLHIFQTTKNDNKNGFCSNRLYFMAELLKVAPTEVSECIAKRTFVYSLSFDWLKNSLTELLDMGVSPDRILRDLWVLKYKHETIHERLQRVRDSGIETLYPWMVRCDQEILNRFIMLFQETKSILGDNKSTKIYLADRLDTTPDAIEDMYIRIPALKTIRVTKVKHFVDFLISEGYTPEDIARKPRVLLASPETISLRLEKLRKIGLKEINLNVLYKCRKDFKKYCESMEALLKEKNCVDRNVKFNPNGA